MTYGFIFVIHFDPFDGELEGHRSPPLAGLKKKQKVVKEPLEGALWTRNGKISRRRNSKIPSKQEISLLNTSSNVVLDAGRQFCRQVVNSIDCCGANNSHCLIQFTKHRTALWVRARSTLCWTHSEGFKLSVQLLHLLVQTAVVHRKWAHILHTHTHTESKT